MKELKQICQVLLFLSNQDEWLEVGEIIEKMDLSADQVKQALKQLKIKQKIQKRKAKGSLTEYKFIDELVRPNKRPAYVKCRSPVSRAIEARSPIANCWLFAQQKIDLLERLKSRVSDRDKDLIIGMINDYSSQVVKRKQ